MTVEALKSANITNLDASPMVQNTAGAGAPCDAWMVNDYVTISAAASVGSTYRMVRVPTIAKVKRVMLESAAMGAGAVNVSVYYSDSLTDGTPANLGVIVPTTGDQFFASDVNLASAVSPTDITNESGNYPLNKRNLPLWSALGLTADPGGFFDLVLVVHTTAITTGGALCGLSCEYTW